MVQDIYPHKLHNEFDPNVQATQFPRQIAITDKKIRWYNNDGKVYYCEWKDFNSFKLF